MGQQNSGNISSLSDTIFVVDESGKIELVYKKNLNGIDLDEIVKNAISEEQFAQSEVEYKESKGETGYLRLTSIPFSSEGKKKTIVFVDDVTNLKKNETFLSTLESLPLGILIADEEGKIIYMNREFKNITGYTDEDIKDIKTLFGNQNEEFFFSILEKKANHQAEFTITCKDGTKKDVEANIQDLKGKGVVITIRDVTNAKLEQKRLKESEKRFRSIFETSRDAIYIISSDGKFIDVNDAFCEMFGLPKEEILKKNAKEAYVSVEDKVKLKAAIEQNGFVKDYELKLKKPNGEVIDCVVTVTGVKDETGRIVEYRGIIRDITEKKRAEEKIRYMALHDMLTGLPNRSLFGDRLNMALGHAKRTNEMVAVMMLDLDGFKDINDLYGHELGDRVLKEVAKRLTKVVRRTDTIARMGGDEFMGIFAGIKRKEDICTVAKKILEQFQEPIGIEGKSFLIRVSIGFSLYPDDGVDLDSLLRKADVAMYEIKRKGGNGFSIYGKECNP